MPVIEIKRDRDDCCAVKINGVFHHTPASIGLVGTNVNPVRILNDIHDWAQVTKDTAFYRGWTGLVDLLVANKGNITIEPSELMKIPYSFDEIEAFFDDKPGLYVKDEDSPSPCDITVTPWKPYQGDPILLRLPHVMADHAISQFIRMFVVHPIAEVRWQRGHVKVKQYDCGSHVGYMVEDGYNGNGHYVTK